MTVIRRKPEVSVPYAFLRLRRGIHDMVTAGRLKREHIPDDYDWLIEVLRQCSQCRPLAE